MPQNENGTKIIYGDKLTTDKRNIFIGLLFFVIIAMSTSGCVQMAVDSQFRRGFLEGSDQTFNDLRDALKMPEEGQGAAIRLHVRRRGSFLLYSG